MSYEMKLTNRKYFITTDRGRLDGREFDTYEEAMEAHQHLKTTDPGLFENTNIASFETTKRLLTE